MIGNMKSKFSNEASPSSLVFCNNTWCISFSCYNLAILLSFLILVTAM